MKWKVIGRFQAESDHKSDLIRFMFYKDPFATTWRILYRGVRVEARRPIRRLLQYCRGEMLVAGSREKK